MSEYGEHEVTNGLVPSSVVKLLIENIRELTSKVDQLPDRSSKDFELLTSAITDLVVKINTPPRHEELDRKLSNLKHSIGESDTSLNKKLDGLNICIKDDVSLKIKWMTRSVWIIFGLFSAAILVASFFINYNNDEILREFQKKIDKMELRIDKR